MSNLSSKEIHKQLLYRDARFSNTYDDIWKSVGKCVFCDLKDKYIFFEENDVVMTVSLYAYIDGHLMIIPRRHVKSTKELNQKEWESIRKFSFIAKKIIKDVHGIKGMQIVQKDGVEAQSTVNHLHFHCIPFDKPDLNNWNYRKLKFTPLENVQLYKQARKKIINYEHRFDLKYVQPSSLPIICNLVLVNNRKEILFQERKAEFKLKPDFITMPGGYVDDFNVPLEIELAREVFEETNIILDPSRFKLISSSIESISRVKLEPHLRVKYTYKSMFILNSYVYSGYDNKQTIKAGDDIKRNFWISISDVQSHQRISKYIKQVIGLIYG